MANCGAVVLTLENHCPRGESALLGSIEEWVMKHLHSTPGHETYTILGT